jgi:hypothetical protein
LSSSGLNPQGDRAMVKTKMTSDPAQVHPIHVHLQRFVAYFFWVGPRFRLGCVFDLTEHAAIALASTACFSGSVLAFRSMTFWTFDHAPILAQILATPPLQAVFFTAPTETPGQPGVFSSEFQLTSVRGWREGVRAPPGCVLYSPGQPGVFSSEFQLTSVRGWREGVRAPPGCVLYSPPQRLLVNQEFFRLSFSSHPCGAGARGFEPLQAVFFTAPHRDSWSTRSFFV